MSTLLARDFFAWFPLLCVGGRDLVVRGQRRELRDRVRTAGKPIVADFGGFSGVEDELCREGRTGDFGVGYGGLTDCLGVFEEREQVC